MAHSNNTKSADNLCCGPTNCEELQICHCGEYQDTKYDIIECEHIEQKPLEKVLSILPFMYGFIVVVLCVYWLKTFMEHRDMRAYRLSLRWRRPLCLVISYAVLLPSIFLVCISDLYLYYINMRIRPEITSIIGPIGMEHQLFITMRMI